MARNTVEVVGIPGMEKALAEAAAEIRAAAEQAVAEETDDVHDDAVQRAPRVKGALERGIRAKADGLEGQVRATARHSTFVEHGTYKDKAQPFMVPTAERARPRFKRRAAELIRRALGG